MLVLEMDGRFRINIPRQSIQSTPKHVGQVSSLPLINTPHEDNGGDGAKERAMQSPPARRQSSRVSVVVSQ